MMKNIVVLFAGGDMTHALENIFDGKNAFDLAVQWAYAVAENGIVLLTTPSGSEKLCSGATEMDVVTQASWTNASVAAEIAAACTRHNADFAVFAWADCPLLSLSLTKELIHILTAYKAEYSFADGFPYGFAPEVIDKGACSILASLAAGSQKQVGSRAASRDALFSIMSGDINSFEIETHLSDKDYRLLRLSFDCSLPQTALATRRAYENAKKAALISDTASLLSLDVYAFSDLAEKNGEILQTLPAFYNIQLSGKELHALSYVPRGAGAKEDMPFSSFKALAADIARTSENAVVSLSLFGEPLLHPDFVACVKELLSYTSLTVFIETCGTLVTESLAKELADACAEAGAAGFAQSRIIWCVLLDACTPALYAKMHNLTDSKKAEADFALATQAVAVLEAYFPHAVYPQLVRTKQNECELEAFYRFWKKSDSASAGDLIIQKYDRFCALLPDEKSADLSPVKRNPCWHLRRDFCILSDGSVPLCKSLAPFVATDAGVCKGNALTEGIAAVWERFKAPLASHIHEQYEQKCQVCDEYYTFNF